MKVEYRTIGSEAQRGVTEVGMKFKEYDYDGGCA